MEIFLSLFLSFYEAWNYDARNDVYKLLLTWTLSGRQRKSSTSPLNRTPTTTPLPSDGEQRSWQSVKLTTAHCCKRTLDTKLEMTTAKSKNLNILWTQVDQEINFSDQTLKKSETLNWTIKREWDKAATSSINTAQSYISPQEKIELSAMVHLP